LQDWKIFWMTKNIVSLDYTCWTKKYCLTKNCMNKMPSHLSASTTPSIFSKQNSTDVIFRLKSCKIIFSLAKLNFFSCEIRPVNVWSTLQAFRNIRNYSELIWITLNYCELLWNTSKFSVVLWITRDYCEEFWIIVKYFELPWITGSTAVLSSSWGNTPNFFF
jgi:hypothetical protein